MEARYGKPAAHSDCNGFCGDERRPLTAWLMK